MPDDPTDRRDPGVDDTGDPIAGLADLGSDAPGGFLEGLRRRIERRQSGSHLLALSWYGMVAVFFEFLDFFFGIFGRDGSNKGGSA